MKRLKKGEGQPGLQRIEKDPTQSEAHCSCSSPGMEFPYQDSGGSDQMTKGNLRPGPPLPQSAARRAQQNVERRLPQPQALHIGDGKPSRGGSVGQSPGLLLERGIHRTPANLGEEVVVVVVVVAKGEEKGKPHPQGKGHHS